jgi:hypothetical protein
MLIKIFYLTGYPLSTNIQYIMKQRNDNNGEEGWEYGDDWRQGSPDAPASEDNVEYVTILRGDTGNGYDDSVMIDLVGYLGSRGIRATYDSFSIGLEPAAIKTYVLKVEAGKEEEAGELLREKFNG